MLGAMRVRALLVVAFAATLPALAGCGTASAPSAPTGVDQLVVPTPTPDPADFVDDVDNPWLPLRSGRTWTYEVTTIEGSHRVRASVAEGPTVSGVPTTALVTRAAGESRTDWFAEDEHGNVWWFGRRGVWRAGADGAEAGLAMPADPRLGDGWRAAYRPGVVEDTLRVEAVDGSEQVGAGTYDDLLVLERRSVLEPGASTQLSYARGVGMVAERVVAGGYRTVRLVRVTG